MQGLSKEAAVIKSAGLQFRRRKNSLRIYLISPPPKASADSLVSGRVI
jgi:hypothetical protein